MINFCRNSFHSMLGIPHSDDRRNPPRRSHIFPPPDHGGLRLLVESPAIGSATASEKLTDPGAWGLHEATLAAGGLGLCTESLGSESCDSGIEINAADESASETDTRKAKRQLRSHRSEVRYPPPLPWMIGRGGRRTRFLKAERSNGRIVLTEIRINQPPDILRAIRTDGRLRLELVETDPEAEADFNGCLDKEEETELTEETEDNGERWELPRVRHESQRCVEAVNGDGNTPLWWSHRFVTTA